MTDAFTRATPTWLNAQRLGAHSGAPLTVTVRPLSILHMLAEAAALGVFLGLLLFGAVCGLALLGVL